MKRAAQSIILLVFVACANAQSSKSAQQVVGMPTATRTPSGPASTTLIPSQIFSRARPSVVVIVASDQKGQREALGSGFIVSSGRIATNHHVVEGMNEAYVVFSDGDVKPVSKVVADSGQQDLIILAVETGKRSALMFGDELSLQQGDSVYALGAPKGLELSFTNGIVSSFRKSNAQFLIQTTAPIAPGSSGGPLFDRTGRVVGVTTSLISDAPGIYFSVGIGDVKRLLRTPQPVLLPFDEWAKQQAKVRDSQTSTRTNPSDTQRAPDKGLSLQQLIYLIERFSEAHGTSVSDGKLHTNFFESGAILDPSHPCGGDIVHDFPNATAEHEVERVLVIFNLANVDATSITVDGHNNLKLEMSLFYEATSFVGEKLQLSQLLQNAKEQTGSRHVVFDSRENAEEFARYIRDAVLACQERKERGEPF
ncbi:MAG TPA: S1C family serine protease [Candidatus Acidoferrum sp.]|nr:S1C family serine protease [Candidatus Acidoferrum sp.]